MENNTKGTNKIKITSGIRAGLWLTIGAGLGDLQTVPPKTDSLQIPSIQIPTVGGDKGSATV